jgi:hypothetical protein
MAETVCELLGGMEAGIFVQESGEGDLGDDVFVSVGLEQGSWREVECEDDEGLYG